MIIPQNAAPSKIEKLILPGVQALLSQALDSLLAEQEAEFAQREAAFRKKLHQIVGEIAVKVASAIAYDDLTGTITITMKLPR